MKKLIVEFALVMTATIVWSVSCLAASADTMYTTGSRLYSDGDYEQAEEYFVKALEKNKKHTSAMFMLAETVSQDVRRLTEAEGWYKKVLDSPRADRSVLPRALFSLGKLYILLGHHEDALDCFKRLLAEYPDFYEMADVYNDMGVAAYRLDRYDRALAYFKSALKVDPGLMEATFNMKNVQSQLAILNTARYHQRIGNNEAAIEHYMSAIDRYPNYVAAWYQLGLLYLGEEKYDLALKDLERAGALNHGFIADKEIPYRMAAAYTGRGNEGDTEAALAIYDKIGNYKDSRLLTGEIYASKGETARAAEIFESITGEDIARPIKAEAYYQLGLLHVGKGDRQRAMESFQKALATEPKQEKYRNPPTGPMESSAHEEVEEEEGDMSGMEEYY